jgi:hypothetical protein
MSNGETERVNKSGIAGAGLLAKGACPPASKALQTLGKKNGAR